MAASNFHVLILGAGLGGMALAQMLRQKGISFEIFEVDQALHARSQGWAIGLHSIIDDLFQAVPDDLPDLYACNHLLPLTATAQMSFYIGGKKFFVEDSEDSKVIRVNRAKFRDWLATDLPIQFGKRVTSIEQDSSSVTLHFDDGKTVTGSVLVGADGVNSFARLNPLPLAVIVGEPTLKGDDFNQQFELGRSAWVVIDEVSLFVGLNAVRSGGGGAKYYWILMWQDEKVTEGHELDSATQTELLKMALSKSEALPDKFRKIVTLTDSDQVKSHGFSFRDLVLKDLPQIRVTLLGDAAHAMTPFRGEGGMHALRDALSLSQTLTRIAEGQDCVKEMKTYQDEMLARGSDAVLKSRGVLSQDASGPRMAWGQEIRGPV